MSDTSSEYSIGTNLTLDMMDKFSDSGSLPIDYTENLTNSHDIAQITDNYTMPRPARPSSSSGSSVLSRREKDLVTLAAMKKSQAVPRRINQPYMSLAERKPLTHYLKLYVFDRGYLTRLSWRADF